MIRKARFPLRDQSGAALVVALIMLICLTVIALASSLTSIFEIKLSGNKRGSTDAFFTADGGIQAVLPTITNFNTSTGYIAVADTSTLPQPLRSESIDQKFTNPTFSLPSGITFTDQPTVTIYHTKKEGAPRGSGFSATGSYDFAYFVIDSVGRDQLEVAALKSNSEVVEKVVRLLPTLQGGN
jgi:Tfp pilus assembly protein PilX